MVFSRGITTIALAFFCLYSVNADSRTDELVRRRNKSGNGVISLDDREFGRFLDGTSRPYGLYIFFKAKAKAGSSLRMDDQFYNFKLVAEHMKKSASDPARMATVNKLFFVEMEFADSQRSFGRLGVNSIPWVIYLSPGNQMQSNGAFVVSDDDRLMAHNYGKQVPDAKDYASFIQSRSGIHIGEVYVPSIVHHPLFWVAAVAVFAMSAHGAWLIYTSSWIGHPWIWTAAVLAVFAFATSGGLHNIIRGIPFTTVDKQGMVKWYVAEQGQLGAEGAVVGLMYVAFALCCITLIKAPKWFGSSSMFQPVCCGSLVGAVFLCAQIVQFYTWKTGYRWKFYLWERLFQ